MLDALRLDLGGGIASAVHEAPEQRRVEEPDLILVGRLNKLGFGNRTRHD